MRVLAWNDNHTKIILGLALAVIIVLAGKLIWNKVHPPAPITLESQKQAATPAGVEKAANAAQVPLSPAQAAVIAKEIKEGADKQYAVAQTIGARLEDTIRTELKKSGGQFAIVTDPKNSASVPALPTMTGKAVTAPQNAGTISPSTPVTLNQYNIKAYPDRLIQVGGSFQEVLAAYSWRVNVPKIPLIAPHGDVGYLGFYGHANFDHLEMSRIGIMLTIAK